MIEDKGEGEDARASGKSKGEPGVGREKRRGGGGGGGREGGGELDNSEKKKNNNGRSRGREDKKKKKKYEWCNEVQTRKPHHLGN